MNNQRTEQESEECLPSISLSLSDPFSTIEDEQKSQDSGVILDAKCLAFDITSELDLSREESFRKASFMTIDLDERRHRDHSFSGRYTSESRDECHNQIVPPDGGYGWLVVFASFMCNLTVDGICYTFGIFLPHFMTEFSSGKAITALAGSLSSGCYMTAGLFVSGLVNRYGCRPIAIIGAIVSATFLFLSTLVPNIYFLIVTYGLVTGIFFGFVYLPSIVSVGFYFTSKRALATGIAVCGSGMGAFSFAPMVSVLIETYDWKTTLRILASLMLVCVAYGCLMKPLEVAKKKTKKNVHPCDRSSSTSRNSLKVPETGPLNDGKQPELKPGVNLRKSTRHEQTIADKKIETTMKKSDLKNSNKILDISILRLPVMALLSLANIFGMTGYYIPYVYITGFAMENIVVEPSTGKLATPNEAALLLSAIGISNVAGRLAFGMLTDYASGAQVMGIRITALFINNCCLLITGVATLFIPFCTSYWTILAACIAFGFFISCYMSLTSIILVDLLGLERLSTTFGVIIFFRGISSIIGPPLAGLLYEYTLSYTGVFLVAGALIVASSLTHFAVHRFEK